MNRKLLLNSLSGTTLYAVNIVVTFIISPVLIRSLGNRNYGLWELVMSVVGYMGLLDLGIGGTLVRFVSVADGKQDKNDLQQVISTAFIFFTVVGTVAVLIFFAFGYSPSLIAGSETKDISNLGTVFLLLGVNAGMLFPKQVFITTLMGVQRHYFINNVRIFLAIVRACLTYYLLMRYQGRGLIILALLEPIFTAIQFAMFAGAVHLDNNIPSFSFSAVTFNKTKEMLTFGIKSATMLVASRLQNQSVPLIIGNMIGLGQIVYFVLPNRLVNYASGVSQAIGFPLTPYFGAAVGRGDHDDLVKSWLNTTLALQIISLTMPIIIFFCGETFLGLWIGQEYAVAGRNVLYILLTGMVADSLAINAFRILTAQGMHGRCALVWLVFSAFSIPVGVWGAHTWGVAGVAAATTGVTILANLLTVCMACATMQIPLTTYFSNTILRIATPLLLLILSLNVLTVTLVSKNYTNLLLQVIISGVIYFIAVWRFTLTEEIRIKLTNRFNLILVRQN